MELNSTFLTDIDKQRLVELEQFINLSNENSVGYPVSKDLIFQKCCLF